MTKYILLSFVGGVVLTVAAGAAYFYLYPMAPAPIAKDNVQEQQVVAVPDDTVLTGPVVAITASTISLAKQNGTTVTFSIASGTPVILASTQPGIPGTLAAISDIKVGVLVMVQADKADVSAAAVILIIPPEPAQ